MALAAGIADGLGYGDNAKAAILSRGIVEMAALRCKGLGADPRTFHGLAGVGDLAVTAFSRHGRNRAFGERIGRGETLRAGAGGLAEGRRGCVDLACRRRARRNGAARRHADCAGGGTHVLFR
jgi:glycerol-3-phosphate dehydrogenase (NAD(P)+)